MPRLLIVLIVVFFTIRCQNQQTAHDMQQKSRPIRIVFFGNSLTAAYGLEPDLGFVAILGQKLATAGYNVEILNAGISGETTAGGLQRLGYILEAPLDILVLELGVNDAYYGEEPATIKQNLQQMIDLTQAAYPQARILLLGINPPETIPFPKSGAFYGIYEELARENQLPLTPDLIAHIRDHPRRYLFDDIHPNAEGHRRLAETVWPDLREVVRVVME